MIDHAEPHGDGRDCCDRHRHQLLLQHRRDRRSWRRPEPQPGPSGAPTAPPSPVQALSSGITLRVLQAHQRGVGSHR